MKRSFFLLLFPILTLIYLNTANATSFVAEASRVIDKVSKESKSASNEIEQFYREFSRPASKMIELEMKVEEWKRKGYLCSEYKKCPEKYDLIYAYYGKYMTEIHEIFEKHRNAIQTALSRFHRVVYEGRDRIADLKSDDMVVTPDVLSRIRKQNEILRVRKSQLERECPLSSGVSLNRECRAKWRALNREARQLNKRLQRLQYMNTLFKLKASIVDRLDNILAGYMHLEEDAVESLANYAFLFEQFNELSGTGGIGKLLDAVQVLKDLNEKIQQMEQVAKGFQSLVVDVAKLADDRLKQIEAYDIQVTSRSEEIDQHTALLEANEYIIEKLEQDISMNR